MITITKSKAATTLRL